MFLLLWGVVNVSCPLSCPLPAEVPARIAVISDRLRSVLGDSSEENGAAPLDCPVQVAVPAPRLAPCHQSVSAIWLGLRNCGAGREKCIWIVGVKGCFVCRQQEIHFSFCLPCPALHRLFLCFNHLEVAGSQGIWRYFLPEQSCDEQGFPQQPCLGVCCVLG